LSCVDQKPSIAFELYNGKVREEEGVYFLANERVSRKMDDLPLCKLDWQDSCIKKIVGFLHELRGAKARDTTPPTKGAALLDAATQPSAPKDNSTDRGVSRAEQKPQPGSFVLANHERYL
jgi:hypothetical protein